MKALLPGLFLIILNAHSSFAQNSGIEQELIDLSKEK